MELVALLRGLLRLGVLLGLIAFWLTSFRLLVREPAQWQYRFFHWLGWLSIAAVLTEVVVRTAFRLGLGWLQLTYGILTALLIYGVAGLAPKGWLWNSLEEPPDKVGPYYFWASFIGILLWLRFTSTG